MQAVWYERNGSAREVLNLGELETPRPKAGEVLVKVGASGVNPTDVKARRATPLNFTRVIPHNDGAGTIEAVGEGVDPARVGQKVWLYGQTGSRANGTAAEYTVLPAAQTVPLPANTSFEEGAALGIPALTAHRCLFMDGPIAGQTILVSGAAGGVGLYAVQLAKFGGARVIATVSSEDKAALARQAGADDIINYREEDPASQIKRITGEEGVDRVIEVAFGANLALNLEVLKVNGVISSYASDEVREPQIPFYSLMYKSITVHTVLVFQMPPAARVEAIASISHLLEEDKLQHFITRRFSLDQTAEAHEAVETGHMSGKAILVFS